MYISHRKSAGRPGSFQLLRSLVSVLDLLRIGASSRGISLPKFISWIFVWNLQPTWFSPTNPKMDPVCRHNVCGTRETCRGKPKSSLPLHARGRPRSPPLKNLSAGASWSGAAPSAFRPMHCLERTQPSLGSLRPPPKKKWRTSGKLFHPPGWRCFGVGGCEGVFLCVQSLTHPFTYNFLLAIPGAVVGGGLCGRGWVLFCQQKNNATSLSTRTFNLLLAQPQDSSLNTQRPADGWLRPVKGSLLPSKAPSGTITRSNIWGPKRSKPSEQELCVQANATAK